MSTAADVGPTSFAPGLDTDKPLPKPGTEADSAAAAVGIEGVAPPSQVADTVYPNVPETTEPQQGATGPGQGTVFDDGDSPTKPKFKDQVNGYAKKIAGKVFKNENEVQQGKEMMGEAPTQTGVASTTPASHDPAWVSNAAAGR